MSDTMQISAEDRERLAKGKFTEWLRELGPDVIKEVMQDFIKEQRGQQQPPQQQQQQPPANGGGVWPPQQQQPQGRKRSLLEVALSDTFGF